MRNAIQRRLNPAVTAAAIVSLPMLMSARMGSDRPVETDPGEATQLILSHQYGLSDSDIRKIERGKVVTQVLETDDDREVSMISIVKVTASRAQLLGYARDLRRFANTGFVTEFRSMTPAELVSDIQTIEVRSEDLKAVRSCEMGDCDMKLPESTIRSIAALDSETDDFASEASAIVRSWLRDYLARYLSSGNQALVVYADRQEVQPLATALERLLTGSPSFVEAAPELHRFLAASTVDGARALEESYYWAIEEFGMRPLTTITQQVIYLPDTISSSEIWVAQKLLYASHYLQASLRVARLVEEVREHGESASYMIYLQHLLFDGRVGGVKRAFLTSALQRNMQGRMQAMRDDLEAAESVLLLTRNTSTQ